MTRVVPALCLSVAVLAGAPRELHRYEAVEPLMGTLVRVTVYTPDEQTAKTAFRAAFDRLRDLDGILSDYEPGSELNRIAKTAAGRAARVSEDLFTVLRASQDLAAATGGAFDVTQAPVIRLWREARRTGRMPDAGALRDAAARTGFRKLRLDGERRTVRFDTAGMALDVGGIGKGYAASEAIAALGARGVRSALVAVSGDLAFSDAPPGERGWRIGVHSGDPAVLGVPAVLELTNGAVSTAGSSEQYVDIGGRRYSHIIDPSSGMGLPGGVTVTVVAPHGLEADGLDTAASVLGVERGLALVESHSDAAALFLEQTSTGIRVRQSSAFVRLAAARRPVPDR
ncbi:MAG TPA: FAD:protein FMN transferase [Vicinamibacterales bacterium]|nr:FAD:protein FMN transferase [Vicinamibacterales bacterium]